MRRRRRRSQRPDDSHVTSVGGAVVMVIFGIIWTAVATVITRMGPIPVVGKFFPLIGCCIVVFAVIQLRRQLRLREMERRGVTEEERDAFESGQDRINRLMGSVIGFVFAAGWTMVTRMMPIPFLGKFFMLVGIIGMVITGRQIYREIKAMVNR